MATPNPVHRLIVDVAPRLSRLEADRLARLDEPLTHRQYRILHQIGLGRDTATALRDVAQTSLAAISSSIETLHRRGLVARRSSDQDRRVSTLRMTDRGRDALSAAEGAITTLAGDVIGQLDLSADEWDTLAALVDAVAGSVRHHHAALAERQHGSTEAVAAKGRSRGT